MRSDRDVKEQMKRCEVLEESLATADFPDLSHVPIVLAEALAMEICFAGLRVRCMRDWLYLRFWGWSDRSGSTAAEAYWRQRGDLDRIETRIGDVEFEVFR